MEFKSSQEAKPSAGIRVLWDDADRTTIRIEATEEWTWEDFDAAVAEAERMGASVPHRVYGLVSSAPESKIPGIIPAPSFLTIRDILQAHFRTVGLVVFVGVPQLAKIVISTFVSAYPELGQKIRLAASLDEARDIIADCRGSDLADTRNDKP
jgi:hypothetical protein